MTTQDKIEYLIREYGKPGEGHLLRLELELLVTMVERDELKKQMDNLTKHE